MHIRLATAADIPSLCDLLGLLFAQEAEFVPDPAAQRRGLAAIIDDSAIGEIFIALEGEQALGMVNLLYSISTALGAPVALLEDMVVAGQARNAGVGARLIEAAIAQARTRGCRRITLLTDRDNLDAQRFYARHGFAASSMLPLRLALD